MKHTSRYTFSFILLLFTHFCLAQGKENFDKPEDTTKVNTTKDASREKPQDTTKVEFTAVGTLPTKQAPLQAGTPTTKIRRYGLRLGVDLYKLTKGLYEDGYKGIELLGDYRLTKKSYLAAELGTESKNTVEPYIDCTTTGVYIKAGFDYNTYDNWLDMENMINVGLRMGFSTFSQQINSYTIYTTNPYFQEKQNIATDVISTGLTAGWLEFVAGIKVQVVRNIFVGFNYQIKMFLFNNEPTGFTNLYIPGFGRTYDGSFGSGFAYTISYFIPFYKKDLAPKLPQAEVKVLKDGAKDEKDQKPNSKPVNTK